MSLSGLFKDISCMTILTGFLITNMWLEMCKSLFLNVFQEAIDAPNT